MRWIRRHILPAYAFLAFCYLMLPIAVVILFSFNAPTGRYNYVWEGFTLDNWLNWDAVPGIKDAVITSLEIAVVSTRPCSERCSPSRSSVTSSEDAAPPTC
jgi:spermidine/putrescine transport system permease protein